jgi:hypothetical protein
MTDTSTSTALAPSEGTPAEGQSNGHRFTTAEKESALIQLALLNGNAAMAARVLAEEGIHVSESTLKNWKATPAYVDTQTKTLATTRAHLAGKYEESAALAISKTNEALEAFTTEGLKPPDVAGAARNLMTTAAVAQDKGNVLRGLPTEITEHRTGAELLARIAQRNPALIYENPDAAIPDADVVDDPAPPAA